MYRGVARVTYASNRDLYAEGLNVIVKVLSAIQDEDAEARRATNTLQQALNKMEGLSVPRVHPAGSSGRRPGAANTNTDLIAHVREYGGRQLRYPQDWRDERLLEEMQTKVQQWLRSSLGWGVELPADVGFVLELSIPGTADVNLLLVPDCAAAGSPVEPSWAQHLALMSTEYDKPSLAVYDILREHAAAAALADFLTGQREEARGVGRLLKAWYRSACASGAEPGSRVGSMALEVMVLAAHQRLLRLHESGRLGNLNSSLQQLELLVEALRLIDDAVTRGSVVMVDAGKWGYRPEAGLRAAYSWLEHDIRVIHPLDPTCNLARPREGRPRPNWEALADEARRLHDTVLYGDFDLLLTSLAGVPGIRDLLRS